MKTLLTALVLLTHMLNAQTQTNEEKLMHVDIYLHTVDVGDMIYNNFGHTAVRIHNRLTNQDLVYNWGVFDPSNPVQFAVKFYAGDLPYFLGVLPTQKALYSYQRDKRTVWEDKLNFTPEQKYIFLKKLAWNTQPENLQYQYQYFFKNCSTIVRDYFDEALSGKIKLELSSKMTDSVYRDEIRSAYATNPEIQFSLEIIMNGNIDQQMSTWEHMFLPIRLREQLLKFETNGQKFISESKVLYQYPSAEPYQLNSFQMLAIIMLIVLLALMFFIKRGNTLIEKTLWIPCLIFSLFLGLLGATLFLNWLFSGHTDLHHNANLWLLWPIDLLIFWIVLKIFWQGKRFSLTNKSKSNWLLYFKAHLFAYPIVIILWLTGAISQNLDWILLYLMPIYALLIFTLHTKVKNCDIKV